MNPTEPKPHSHYFKSVRGLEEIDVYRVIDLFEVTHPALQHALKKVMASGKRGAKDSMQDVQEAIDSLKRYQQMAQEDLQRPYQQPVHEGGLNGHPQELIDSWKPWEVWQWRYCGLNGQWTDCVVEPMWDEGTEYRKKPEAPYVPSDNIIEPDPADPHAELRKTYKPGQRWQVDVGAGWCEVYGQPSWMVKHKYRRHPDDKDPE